MALTRLSHWLIEQPEQIVAVQDGEISSTQAFISRVNSWLAILSAHQGNRWAVYHADAFEFSAILFALWQLDRTACIPSDNCSGTVERLSGYVDGFIGDFPAGLTYKDMVGNKVQSWRALPDDFIALEIYTSGSTGEPQAIAKTISQLDLEIATLESQWPSRQEAVVLTTVSHQHLYGITFRLLWPLSAGQAFARLLCEYSEDVFHQALHYAKFSLVSSPSHLSRMTTGVAWSELSERCQYIISSAAALSKKDSINVSKLLNAPVREIYGSSETGVIAWRIQQEDEGLALWQALPRVELAEGSDKLLSVNSPFVGQNTALTLSDQVLFHSKDKFELLGRKDSIVKVEGKRVSLTAVETCLRSHDWVKDIKALIVTRKRVEVVVALQLSPAGDAQLMLLGRKSVIAVLKKHLTSDFEAVVLPRKWRFIDVMPYNKQGKLPVSTLQCLFEQKPTIKWPKITSITTLEKSVSIHCHIPETLLYFDGHFADNPILPGVTQIHWAEKYGRQLLSINARFKSLEMIKFLQIIPPNIDVILSLEYNDIKNTLLFKYQSEKGVHASGRICFE